MRRLSARSIGSTPQSRALTAYAQAVLDERTACDSDDGDGTRVDLAATITVLADHFLASTTALGAGTDAALRTRVRRHVRLHCGDPALDPTSLAAAFAISRRKLYGLFEPDSDGPAALIRAARVDLARRLLVEEPQRSVSAIAHAAGFREARTFLRAFVGQVGETPSAYRELSLAG